MPKLVVSLAIAALLVALALWVTPGLQQNFATRPGSPIGAGRVP